MMRCRHLLGIPVIIALIGISTSVYAAIPASERSALIALYNSTNGDNWKDNKGWKTPPLDADGFAMSGTEGAWSGISIVDDHVTEIALLYNQLSGSIPPEIGNLSNLVGLYLYSNQLSGSIPPEIGNLSNLVDLYLCSNQLSGSIPPEIGNLSNLVDLYLYSNQLSGTIPPEIGNLSNLVDLYLYSNQLSGTIPESIINLSTLAEYGEIRICNNFLYTENETVRAFLNQNHSGEWESCLRAALIIYYRDADNDGYGNPNNPIKSAYKPSGYVLNNTDCHDNNSFIHPEAIESSTGVDDNCDGIVDNIIPVKVIPTFPSGTIEDATPVFSWKEDPNATWYKLFVWDSKQKKIHAQWYDAAGICQGINCSVTLETELMVGDYEWYVKSWNEYGKIWSDGMRFSFTTAE